MRSYDLPSATCHWRPTVCYVLSSTSNMTSRIVVRSPFRMLVTADYWTSHATARTMNFVCCALRFHPYWFLRLLCFFLVLQEHILLLFHVFQIRWRPHHDYHESDRLSSQKVSGVTSDELTTIFLHQRISITTRDVTKHRFIQLRQSAKAVHTNKMHKRYPDTPACCKNHQKSAIVQQTFINGIDMYVR